MAKYTRNTNKNKYRNKHQEMMRRRRVTTIVVLFIFVLIFALILKSCFSSDEKKDKKEDTSSKTESSMTTDGTTEPVTYERDIAFDTDSSYASNHKYCVGVNRKENVVTVYAKDSEGFFTEAVKAFTCSCGKEGHETPLGTYTTSEKYEWLKMVDGSYAQYTLHINDQIWFHSVPYTAKDKGSLEYDEFNKLGTGASLGCVRLAAADAKWIYDNIEWKTMVFIYDSETPGPLGKPETVKIDTNNRNKGWDPTDPDKANPWAKK
ncbi:MAG: L,D-transpeptidase [Clostridia bacterium]|nr:L,D-transpeptidase [Clostridia bacterium]